MSFDTFIHTLAKYSSEATKIELLNPQPEFGIKHETAHFLFQIRIRSFSPQIAIPSLSGWSHWEVSFSRQTATGAEIKTVERHPLLHTWMHPLDYEPIREYLDHIKALPSVSVDFENLVKHIQ